LYVLVLFCLFLHFYIVFFQNPFLKNILFKKLNGYEEYFLFISIMGIPAYFSYIIKNHNKIIKHIVPCSVSALFIDANSIVYDVVYSLPSSEQITDNIIDKVIEKLYYYIGVVSPTQLIYIAFDGIAPFAKIEQQKKRRYKTAFMESILPPKKGFNTMQITPGTTFMNHLSNRIIREFSEPTLNGVQTIVSTSIDFGEGEHKLCHYLREHPFLDGNVVIYGLDADLIMLAIFHQSYTKNIYVCREKPTFVGVLQNDNKQGDEKELLFLDIRELSLRILHEMNCKDNSFERVYDYVFLCFFLGNDFIPAFPSLNIRSAGMDRLMDTYREHIGKFPQRRFLSGACHQNSGEILWKWVQLFIQKLAHHEREFLIQEYEIRNKWENQTKNRLIHQRSVSEGRTDEEEWINNIPVLFREIEHYISPYDGYWEHRYYESLFEENTLSLIKKVSINYLEGLEWVYIYYTRGCFNTQWKYNYHYPPLLVDLVQHVPVVPHSFLKEDHRVITQKEQLDYIIPPQYRSELGLEPCKDNEPLNFKFSWSFKRYFWESSQRT